MPPFNPWTFWLGALIPVVVVVITNLLAVRKARREQELSLRRDVYLAAVEAASAGMVAVQQLTNPDIAVVDATRLYRDKSSVMTKVYLVANLDTVKVFTKFRDELEFCISQGTIRRAHEFHTPSDPDFTLKWLAILKEWNDNADSLGRLFTSVLVSFRADLGMPIDELELHRVFDQTRSNRRDLVEQVAKLLSPAV
jgi:hypothetical protein